MAALTSSSSSISSEATPPPTARAPGTRRRSLRQAIKKGVDPRASDTSFLAELIRGANHCVFITGAGISTNAGIRDYRGPNGEHHSHPPPSTEPAHPRPNEPCDGGVPAWEVTDSTQVSTPRPQPPTRHPPPAGIWTEAAAAGAKEGAPGVWDDDLYRTIPAATPTIAHSGVKALVDLGHVAYVISQNEDGLHLRSGLDRSRLSELHGNDYIEICQKCKRETVRSFVTYWPDTYRSTNPLGQHVTGRACPHCGGEGSRGARTLGQSSAAASVSQVSQAPSAHAGSVSTTPLPPPTPVAPTGALLDTCVDFDEAPDGDEVWGPNKVHAMARADDAMKKTDLVVAWGTSLHVIAHYFDPWDPDSPFLDRREEACSLVVVNKGPVCDEELAVLKIEEDVDATMAALLRELQVPRPPDYAASEDAVLRAAVEPPQGERRPRAEWSIAAT